MLLLLKKTVLRFILFFFFNKGATRVGRLTSNAQQSLFEKNLHRYPLPFVSLLPCLSHSPLLRFPRSNLVVVLSVGKCRVMNTSDIELRVHPIDRPLNLFHKYNTTYNTYSNYNPNNSYITYQQVFFLLCSVSPERFEFLPAKW